MSKMLMIPYAESIYAVPEDILIQYKLEGNQLEEAKQGLQKTLDAVGDVEGQKAYGLFVGDNGKDGFVKHDGAGRSWIFETDDHSHWGKGSWHPYSN